MTHLHALTMLQHHGPLTMSRLAEMLDVSPSNATGIVDRLEDRGFRDALQTELDVHPDRYSHGPVSPHPDHVGAIPADPPAARTAPVSAPATN